MARSKSVILTKEEKKAVVAGLRQSIKDGKIKVRDVTRFGKEKEKLHAATMKQNAKDLTAAQKELTGFQAQLEAVMAG